MISFILAGLVGLSLGLLGGGGSILAVPILVYVSNIDPNVAVAMSLGIVGIATLFGTIGHYRAGNIKFKTALLFGGPAIPATFLGSFLAQFVSGPIQLSIFSIIMILAAIFMFKGRKETDIKTNSPLVLPTVLSGIFVGILTGLIGVGGGFLIVPALMYFTGTEMKNSVGTSLFIISLNSFFGFYSYLNKVEIPWAFMGKFTVFTIIGIIIGSQLVPFVPQKILRKSFAIFLVVMGVFILAKNLGHLI